ncbi:MAG: CHAT domain-containing protein, partial [Acidobacteria bacterium]|nr:CHAT domain-containing protein [Acidobacteriota bacterium]
NPRFDALPDAAVEGRRLAADWGRRRDSRSRLYLGAQATRSALFEEFAKARVLHIASHAVSSSVFALNTGLVLTPVDGDPSAPEPADDGVLRAWEFLEAPRLRADVVVLSGCETGPGSEWIAMAEGSLDLSRFFLEAGAGAVLSASWRISDEATAEFMTGFHRSLSRGASPDQALNAAQAAMSGSRRWAHPFNWAAFRLVGLGDE